MEKRCLTRLRSLGINHVFFYQRLFSVCDGLHEAEDTVVDRKMSMVFNTYKNLINHGAIQTNEMVYNISINQLKQLLGNPDGCHAHTSTDTHASNTNLLVGALELSQQCAYLSGTGAAEGMPEGDSTTLGIDLFLRKTKLVNTPDALGSESLVDLENIDVILGDAGLLESNGDGLPGANPHE